MDFIEIVFSVINEDSFEKILVDSLKNRTVSLIFHLDFPLPYLPSHHSSTLSCFLSVSFVLFGGETTGGVWIHSFLETPNPPYSRDPLTFSFKSFFCSCSLWLSSSSSSSSFSAL